jgi:hypothetical protein
VLLIFWSVVARRQKFGRHRRSHYGAMRDASLAVAAARTSSDFDFSHQKCCKLIILNKNPLILNIIQLPTAIDAKFVTISLPTDRGDFGAGGGPLWGSHPLSIISEEFNGLKNSEEFSVAYTRSKSAASRYLLTREALIVPVGIS